MALSDVVKESLHELRKIVSGRSLPSFTTKKRLAPNAIKRTIRLKEASTVDNKSR
jgi:hypothetical protein